MAISCRNDVSELVLALAFAHNQAQNALVTDGYHRDLTQNTTGPILAVSDVVVTSVVVGATNATTLPTLVTLVNQVLGVLNQHMLDSQAHLKKDLVNLPNQDGYLAVQSNLFTDAGLAQSIVNVNALKLLFTAHLTQSGVHANNDTTSYGLPSAATDLASAQTLANALKTAVNVHMANSCSPAVSRFQVTSD